MRVRDDRRAYTSSRWVISAATEAAAAAIWLLDLWFVFRLVAASLIAKE